MFFINISLAITAILVITLNQDISLTDASFEVFSALGTVGMTTGITRDLTALSKLVIVFFNVLRQNRKSFIRGIFSRQEKDTGYALSN